MPINKPLHDEGPPGSYYRTPIPDPTTLTTAALEKSIAGLKELLIARLEAVEKAQDKFEDHLTRVPTEVDKQVSSLKELHAARLAEIEGKLEAKSQEIGTRLDGMAELSKANLKSISQQFSERDERFIMAAAATKAAVEAALMAAKEMVAEQTKYSAAARDKAEVSTTKQIDQLNQMIATQTNAVNDKVEDLKQRVTSMEGSKMGKDEVKQDHQWSAGMIIVVVLATLSLFATLYLGMREVAAPVHYTLPAPEAPK